MRLTEYMVVCRICNKAEGVICRHYRHQEAGIIVQDEQVEIEQEPEAEVDAEETKPKKQSKKKKKSLW